jgi:hypothetical protein
MNYQWADGFHAPKNVAAEDVLAALGKLPEPSPENLLAASKRPKHILHDELWSEGDQVWAQRARLDRCRHIIGGVRSIDIIGGKTISTRVVEFIRPNGEGRWASMAEIVADGSLLEAYLMEIERLSQQAADKMSVVRNMLKAKREAA